MECDTSYNLTVRRGPRRRSAPGKTPHCGVVTAVGSAGLASIARWSPSSITPPCQQFVAVNLSAGSATVGRTEQKSKSLNGADMQKVPDVQNLVYTMYAVDHHCHVIRAFVRMGHF